METEIIIHKELLFGVRQPAHLQYFQILLPLDTVKIIGVEAGAWKLWGVENNPGVPDPFAPPINIDPRAGIDPAFLVSATPTIGTLTLKAPGKTNIFYQEEIRQEDNALYYGEPTLPSPYFGQWSHGRNRAIASVDINGDQFIEAYYKDTWEQFYPSAAYYFLHVYIWIQKNNKT